MFEYPLVHPTRDTPSLLLVDSSITGVGLALGLRLAYTGSRSMLPKTTYRADGTYVRSIKGGLLAKGAVLFGLGAILLHQSASYGMLTLHNRGDKVILPQGGFYPYLQ